LARKTAAETRDGYSAKLSDGRFFGDALLDPTVLYSPVTEALFAAGIIPTYCANITGHGWRKVMRHAAQFSYRFHTIPPVPPVLSYLCEAAGLDPVEAYGTFNMGAGFAIFVDQAQAAATVAIAQKAGVDAWVAGVVEDGPKRVVIDPINVAFSGDELQLRA
jgi:phosphoribosylformylglycinamidine cyclo-ligase